MDANKASDAKVTAAGPGSKVGTAHNAKCGTCGKMYVEHTYSGNFCPFGAKHRTVGYTQFARTQFKPIPDPMRKEP